MDGMNHALVLCAGLGIRLRPLTDETPKPLIRFLDRPMIDYAIDALVDAGVTTLGFNGHHAHEQLTKHIDARKAEIEGRGAGRLRSVVVTEPTLLGTGGGAMGVWRALGSPEGTLAIVNGDVVSTLPLREMLKVHRRSGAIATLMVIPPIAGEGAVRTGPSGHFIAELPGSREQMISPRYEPSKPVTFGGVYLVEPCVFDGLPPGTSCLIRHGLAPKLSAGALIAAYEHHGFWADVGTCNRYLSATFRVLADASVFPSGPLKPRAERRYIPDHRSVHPTAEIQANVYVAPGAVIEAGARVGPNVVVGTGCTIRAGAEVSDAVFSDGAEISGRVSKQVVAGSKVLRAT